MTPDFIRWLAEKVPFFKQIYQQGGKDSFIHAREDVLATFQGDVEKKAEELATEKLRALLSPVDERMIISFNEREKAVYIGGQRIVDPGMLSNLKHEAEAILQFDLWRVLNETPKRLAQRALFEDDGKSEVLHVKGRSMLYLLDTQNKILATLKSYDRK